MCSSDLLHYLFVLNRWLGIILSAVLVFYCLAGTTLINEVRHDIAPAARLIDLDEYKISGGEMLYGFVAGLMASNYDITDLYIDGILKVLDHDINRLGVVLDEMAAIAGDSVKVTVTVSADEAALPHDVKKYL